MRRAIAGWRFVALLGVCLCLLWLGPFQLHPPVGWVDPGLYIYWFLNPSENLALRGGDYHGARVAFVVPGWAVHRIFDLVTAQAILASAYALIALVAIYAIAGSVISGFGARAALLVLVGTNPIWLAAMTRGYVDGPSMALGMAALACVARSQAPAGFLRHAGAGALLFAALATHPFGGGLAGLAVLGFTLVRSTSISALFLNGCAMAVGGLAALLLCALGAMLIGFPALFFLEASLPRIGQGLTASADSPFLKPVGDWLGGATRLVLFVMTMVLSSAALWQARGEGRVVMALAAASLLPLVALLVSLVLWSSFVAQFAFYASYIWLPLLPAVILLARACEQSAAGSTTWLLLGLVALAGSLGGALLPLDLRGETSFHWFAWFLVSSGLALCLAALVRGRHRTALIASAVTLSLAGATNQDTATALRLRGGPDNAAQQESLRRLHAFLTEAGALSGRYVIWYGRDRFTEQRALPRAELHSLAYGNTRIFFNALDSLAAPLGWYVPAIGFQMPFPLADTWGQRNLTRLAENPEVLITLCAEPADCDAGMDALRGLGLRVTPGRSMLLDVPRAARVHVALASVRGAAAAEEPGLEQLRALLGHLVAADAMEARRGAPRLDPRERVSWTDHAALPTPGSPPEPLQVACRPEGAQLHCEVIYRLCDTVLSRGLAFERQGTLNRLVSADPPESRPERVPAAEAECRRPGEALVPGPSTGASR